MAVGSVAVCGTALLCQYPSIMMDYDFVTATRCRLVGRKFWAAGPLQRIISIKLCEQVQTETIVVLT
jgi:hypothetical protein